VAALKVLCVDDDPDEVESAGELLSLAGCEVMGCLDGESALAAAAEFRPDVCVLDLTMPGMGGEELAAKLREQAGGRPLRLIALTGHGLPDDHHRTKWAGFDRHLVKPVEPRCLIEAVTGRPART
jgi:two-component system CheB/CheR fusion protein